MPSSKLSYITLQELYLAMMLGLLLLLNASVSASIIYCADLKLGTQRWVEKKLRAADIVLLGKVVSETTQLKDYIDPNGERKSKSMAELIEMVEESMKVEPQPYQSVSLEVIRQWKGHPVQHIVVSNDVLPGQHGFRLQVGKTYLVFIRTQGEKVHAISTVCSNTLTEPQASSRIEILDQISEPVETGNN